MLFPFDDLHFNQCLQIQIYFSIAHDYQYLGAELVLYWVWGAGVWLSLINN